MNTEKRVPIKTSLSEHLNPIIKASKKTKSERQVTKPVKDLLH